jgi:hypothetical protein
MLVHISQSVSNCILQHFDQIASNKFDFGRTISKGDTFQMVFRGIV